MKKENVALFLTEHLNDFPKSQLCFVKEKLLELSDDAFMALNCLDFKNTNNMFLVSLFGGVLGIDRFLVGDTALGLIKLLTMGGIGIFAIVDWFLVKKRTQQYNFDLLLNYLNVVSFE